MSESIHINTLIKNKKLYYVFISFVLIFVLLGMGFYKISFANAAKYLLFQLIYVYIPGRLIYRLLKLKEDGADSFIISYALGIVFTIVEYLAFYNLSIRSLLYFIGPLFSLIEIIFTAKALKNNNSRFNISFESLQVFTIFSALFFITFISFTLQNPTPALVGRNAYPQDLLWTMGNTQALLRGFPPMDSRLSGVTFNYHYFISIHLAMASYITKIDTFQMFFHFSQWGKLVLLVFSTYFLGKTYFKNDKKAVLFTFIYFFTHCASSILAIKNAIGVFLNINFAHLTYDPFGYELAIAFMFMCVAFLIKQMRKKTFDMGYFICSILFLFGTTGSKGPLGAIIVAVLFAVIIILLIQKKKSNRLLVYFVFLTIVFLTTYLYFLGGLSGSTSTLDFYLGYSVKDTLIGQFITKLWGNGIVAKTITALAIPLHFALFLPFAAIPFILWFAEKLRDIKNTRASDFFIGGIAICGIIGTYLLKQDGHSELYFIMSAIPFIELCALNWIFENYRGLSRYYKLAITFTLILSLSTTLFMLMNISRSGLRQVRLVYNKTQEESTSYYNAITKYEFEAMDWIKNNTHKDAIIAADRYYYGEANKDIAARYFYYSAFSERQFYLEGWYYRFRQRNSLLNDKIDTMNNFYKGSEKALNKLQQENVSFIVVSKFSNPDFKPFHEKLKLVFKNRDVEIYSIMAAI